MLALRLPFGSSFLWAWDSVLYARAIEHFAVDLGRPHPPGYLFYVLAARVAASWSADPNAGLVIVSAMSGALTCAAGFLIGRRYIGTAGGILAAAILATSPLLWHYSEVAYPYATLAFLTGALGALLWWARKGGPAAPVLASLALGVAAGFRQDMLLLGGLWLYVVTRHGWRTTALSAAAGAVGCLLWLIPTAAQSGGLATYLAVVTSQVVGVSGGGVVDPATVGQNGERTLVGLRAQIGWTWPLLAVGFWAVLRRRRVPPVFVLLWIGPPLALYLVGHIGEWGYTLSVAVPIAIAAAIGAVHLLAPPGRRRAVVAFGIATLLVLNGATFVLGSGPFSLHEIARHDQILAEQSDYVRGRFPPRDTFVVAQGNYQHVLYYLPEYAAVYLPQGRHLVGLIPTASGARWVVLFGAEGRMPERSRMQRVMLPNSVVLRVIRMRSGERLTTQDQVLTLAGE